MQIDVLKDGGANATFELKGVSSSFVNALRRAIISDLPAFAIDEIEMLENTSPLFNEYVAGRVGLVPLTWEDSASPEARVLFSLNAEAVDAPRVVYAGELTTDDPNIKVFATHVPLMKLGKGQRLRLQGTALIGTAKRHAKFQGAMASFGQLPDFKKSTKCNKCGECAKACPQKIISDSITLTAPEKCILCEECVEACEKDALKVIPKEDEFVLFVESYNNVSAKGQVKRGLEAMKAQADAAEKELK